MHIAATFAVAAAQSDLKLIVTITQWLGHPQHPSLATRQSYLTDHIFDMVPGVDVIKINTGWFADNYILPELLAMVTQLGMFPFPLERGRLLPYLMKISAGLPPKLLLIRLRISAKQFDLRDPN